jgi:cytoskeleton protein RodZ
MVTTFQELGGQIREKREAGGLSIEDVAARIKISSRILKAIEEGATAGLPHAVYTKRFTRAFGLLVGFDREELDARLEEVFQAACLEEAKHEPVLNRNADLAYPGTARRFIALLVFILLLWGLAGGCWYVAVNYGSAILEFVKQPFSAFGGHTEPPPAPPAGSGSGTGAALNTSAASGTGGGNAVSRLMRSSSDKGSGAAQARPDDGKQQVPDASLRAQGTGPPDASTAPSRPADPPAQAGGHASGPVSDGAPPPPGEDGAPSGAASGAVSAGGERAAPDGNNQVLIISRETCWMSSRADGAKGRDYVLKPGDRFVLTYNSRLELTLGNAGGVDLVHNGKNFGPGGQRGQKVVLYFPEKTR